MGDLFSDTAHVVVRGGVVQTWVDGAQALSSIAIPDGEGRLCLAAAAGDHYQLRNLSLRVMSPGTRYVPGVVPELERKVYEILTNATMTDLRRLSNNADAWTLGVGILNLLPGKDVEEPSFIMFGEPTWREYRISFDVRDLEGTLGVIVRDIDEEQKEGDTLELSGELLADKIRWHTFTMEVTGLEMRFSVDGGEVRTEKVEFPAGRAGLVLYPKSRCQIRKLIVETFVVALTGPRFDRCDRR